MFVAPCYSWESLCKFLSWRPRPVGIHTQTISQRIEPLATPICACNFGIGPIVTQCATKYSRRMRLGCHKNVQEVHEILYGTAVAEYIDCKIIKLGLKTFVLVLKTEYQDKVLAYVITEAVFISFYIANGNQHLIKINVVQIWFY